MINFNKKDAVADAIKDVLNKEEIDVNDRTEDKLGGRDKTKRKDDTGPAGNFKSTKVRFHAGPKNEEALPEELKGKQSKIDKNHNGKIDGEDFKILRNKGTKTLKSFKEERDNPLIEELINEVMAKDASAGAWIHDFVHSDNPKFEGKSKAKRKEMALAAYYAKQRNEETVEEGLGDKVKTGLKKFLNKVGGGSDEDQRKRLQKNMGVPQTGKPSMAKQNEETVEEGWDDMVKAAKDTLKDKPKPNGGAGVKQGTAYGGGKQKDKPEQEVKEGKQPMDSVPFDPPYNTSSSPAETKDKSGAVHTPMSRVKHLARQAMKKVKTELTGKTK